MKKTLSYTLLLLFATLFIAVLPTEAEGAVYEDTVRLHILANSDKSEDQELKLKVRDALLLEFGDELSSSQTCEDAALRIFELLAKIEEHAEKTVRECGYDYSVSATLTTEWYETRDYESFTLPKGYYKSLRIILGSGEGKNWWCVMYPPLCIDMATESAPSDDAIKKYNESEFRLVSGGRYRAKFKILELVSSIFS